MSLRSIGLGRAVITPRFAGATAGWSVAGLRSVRDLAPGDAELVATVLAIRDGEEPPVVLVYADLHCGGTALWRLLSERTGVPLDRLILAGTHTHAGPGHIYGSVLYNAMCTRTPIPWAMRARGLADVIAPAILQAVTGAVPATLTLSRAPAWGVASNRAVPAVMRLPLDEISAFGRVGPGRDGPPRPLADQLCDPRVSCLVALEDGERPFAALATAAVHGTALGKEHPHWGADWAGPARVRAEGELHGVMVGYAGSCSGDVSPLPLDEHGHVRTSVGGPRSGAPQGLPLARAVGEGIAEATLAAVREAGPGATFEALGEGIGVAHTMWEPAQDPRLGLPTPGLATAGGGVDGVPDPEVWARVHAGVEAPGYDASKALPPPQHPKVAIQHSQGLGALPIAQAASRFGPRALPLHAVRIGNLTLVTVPGEATTFVGWRLERAVHAAVGGRVLVLGYAGDYAGYWVTPEAYQQQRYEGASTLFGAEASTALIERLTDLARQAHYAAGHGGEADEQAG